MSFTYFLTFPFLLFPALISHYLGARTLFKFMKKFEAVLSEPCRSSLAEGDEEEQPDSLPRPTGAAASKESPIQRLNRVLRETLLARPAAVQVLARGMVPMPRMIIRLKSLLLDLNIAPVIHSE